MDSSSNSQNKLIVLAAVAIIGAFAGQHFFKQTPPAAPNPWGMPYPMAPQTQMVQVPPGGQLQSHYGMPLVNGQFVAPQPQYFQLPIDQPGAIPPGQIDGAVEFVRRNRSHSSSVRPITNVAFSSQKSEESVAVGEPDAPPAVARAIAFQDASMGHGDDSSAASPIRNPSESKPLNVQINAIHQSDSSGGTYTEVPAPHRINKRFVKIEATVPTPEKVIGGVASIRGIPNVDPKVDLNKSSELSFTFQVPNVDKSYEIWIEVKSDEKVRAKSDSKPMEVRFTGPRVTGITPDNLAETPGINVVDVQFTEATPLNGDTIAPEQFAFTPSLNVKSANLMANNRVRLTLGDVKEGAYSLQVKSGANGGKTIRDDFGNFLGATYDNPLGKDADARGLIKPVGSDLPSGITAGLKGMTGPNIKYPEFTTPRPSTTGFNPSDKVVTRIARLYYFRDAHRVVQLINREARSYSRQAVDMQQQLADNARRDAENATADRQSSERAAIQAAQRARAAETALNQFQQALVTARQQQSQSETAVKSHEDTHRVLKNDLQDATTARQALEDEFNDPNTTPERKKELTKKADGLATKEDGALTIARRTEVNQRRKVEESDQKMTRLRSDLTKATAEVATAENRVNAILGEIQIARNQEADKREESNKLQAKEDRLQQTLFRREVAAANEDPDTYAPGDPGSIDPIAQVSLSVIGEGLIQLRGPLKGVNLARTLINQIDAPVGQVKVAIHTVQVNGEHGERMEPVVGRIQRYIDHSRFLTTQSAQMLRNAVTLVASRRADQAASLCEGLSQQERDHKYIEMFFGREFLEELRTLDSEFLHTGNKLLSLHSMDSTSLSNALFLLAIAKNDVRQEILQAFEQMVTCNLPQDEMDYFTASNEKYKFGPIFHKQKFVFLGQNAKFVSLRGFFNAEVAGSETMTPMQREFIRLAQIFKSRLVTEIELQQRVMERSLIEDRGDSPDMERAEIVKVEMDSREALKKARLSRQQSQEQIVSALTQFSVRVSEVIAKREKTAKELLSYSGSTSGASSEDVISLLANDLKRLTLSDQRTVNKEDWTLYGMKNYPDCNYKNYKDNNGVLFINTEAPKGPEYKGQSESPRVPYSTILHRIINDSLNVQLMRLNAVAEFSLDPAFDSRRKSAIHLVDDLIKETSQPEWKNAIATPETVDPSRIPRIPYRMLVTLQTVSKHLDQCEVHIKQSASSVRTDTGEIMQLLRRNPPDEEKANLRWRLLSEYLYKHIVSGELHEELKRQSELVDNAFQQLTATRIKEEFATRNAEGSRRPLDHKKFLDMLIDDVEDKFIELMEGTRAHTANIDNYLSRLGQALEDDFNTQFYFPAFKGIREASRYWDVQMGQIETTTILTNNRTFAKVSPQATMEFDLPKRDILIKEAFDSAQAAYEDYGALLGDPTFLALTKMYRGQPASALFGGDSGNPAVRNVLPGLPASTDEKLVAQAQAVAPDFPSALESLIPDPAIYKFETGTGFEIRPVIQPDGQAVVFHFNYMYTTNVREPVRPDEKHLGRVKRHFIDTDVQTGNYEMREVSKYQVALKASRTARGVPLLEDIPAAGILFRPLPNQESSIQQNIILAQTAIFPTLFDLMGLRWAPAVADLDSLRLKEADFVTRGRQRGLKERVFDHSSQQVDEFLRIPEAERRPDLYRPQETTPYVHPNGYSGPGFGLKDGVLREGHNPSDVRPESRFVPGTSRDVGGVPLSIDQSIEVEAPLMEGPSLAPPRGASPQPAPGPRHVPEVDLNQGLPALKNEPGARLNYQSIPSVPASRIEPPTPSPRSTGAAIQSATKGTSSSAVQLQSYRSTSPSASSVQAVPTTAVPGSTTPNSKPNSLQPGQLSPTSAPPQRLPEAPSGIRPAVGSTNSSSKNGTASNTKTGAVSKADASRNPSARDSKATKPSQIVQTSGTESDQFEPAPVPSKKKFGISGSWSKK